MKNLFLLVILYVSGNYCTAQPHAQSVVSTQGDYFWSPTVSVAWTLGEVMSETYAPGNMYLTQGFHQPGNVKKDDPEISFDSFNGFSPNGDGINDILFAYIKGVKKMTFNIYNRWGEKVFTSTDPLNGWDGLYKGKEAQPGVYVYDIYVIYWDNEPVKATGSVTLVR
jgi:gliding motility-associated-like protein